MCDSFFNNFEQLAFSLNEGAKATPQRCEKVLAYLPFYDSQAGVHHPHVDYTLNMSLVARLSLSRIV